MKKRSRQIRGICGKVVRGAVPQLEYAGKPLTSRQPCYWKVRVWDQAGTPSAWSKPARWTMGLLTEQDWGGTWIGTTKNRHVREQVGTAAFGYHSAESPSAEVAKWVQLDLGESRTLDEIRLVPARPSNYTPDTPGFGFPVRFKIEVSEHADFNPSETIVDQTAEDYPNPGESAAVFKLSKAKGQYVRVTATRLWQRSDGLFVLALKQIEVVAAGKNVAANAPVTSLDSIERTDWNQAALTASTSGGDDLNDAAPLLRKEFNLPGKKVVSATATVCGLGYYILEMNGERVGDHQLDPGWTNYDKRCLYVTYDVTPLLRSGTNAVGVTLGNGWYDQTTPDVWDYHKVSWAAPAKLRFNLQVLLDDGSSETVVTDPTWKWSTGDITYQNIRSGETQDKRRLLPDWSKPGVTTASWNPVIEVPAPKGRLAAQLHPPIRTAGEVPVAAITEPKRGVYVVKMAENMSGWARFRAGGQPGQKITLRYGETLLADGTVNPGMGGFTLGRFQTDEIIFGNQPIETFEPHFSYKAFQYVQIEGASTRLVPGDLVGVRVHTDFAEAGSFECSSKLINDLQVMFRRTYLNNMHGLPTDCPHREKLGWMCDGFLASEMGMWNFDAAALYTKWIRDMADDQDADGRMSPVIPGTGWSKGPPGPSFDPLWTGVTVFLPWHLYQLHGDQRILAEHLDAMQRYVDFLQNNSVADLLDEGRVQMLGDWYEADSANNPIYPQSKQTPRQFASNVAWFQAADIVAKSAALLGQTDLATRYAALAARIRAAINAKWLNAATGQYAPDTQCAPAQALVLGLAPEKDREKIAAALLANITEHKGHPSTGIVGTYYLFKALEQLGRDDVAWTMMNQTNYPSWGYMLSQGATAVWEMWKSDASLNHPALASPGFWFYEGLAGIRRAAPGFSKVVIKPGVAEKLEWAKATYRAPGGEIKSQWKRQDKQFTLEVSIPPSVTAEVFVPTEDAGVVSEGGKPVKPVRVEAGYAVFAIGSGNYVYQSEVGLDKENTPSAADGIPTVGGVN